MAANEPTSGNKNSAATKRGRQFQRPGNQQTKSCGISTKANTELYTNAPWLHQGQCLTPAVWILQERASPAQMD